MELEREASRSAHFCFQGKTVSSPLGLCCAELLPTVCVAPNKLDLGTATAKLGKD